jgi:uncharacterized protein involved in tellurium resistance
MPVRGTTHAIIQKKVINLDHDGDRHVMCAWDTCTNDGYEINKVRVNTAAPGHDPVYVQYVFCTERHKQYWINSTKSYGDLPSGYKRGIV